MELFKQKNIYLSEFFEEVNYQLFYRDIFPSGSFERKGKYDDKKGNGIAITIDEDRYTRVTITDEHEQIDDLVNHDFVILNGLSYFGNERTMRNATLLYAMIFDIDGLSDLNKLKNLISHVTGKEQINPRPTYLVNSGHGVHLYYVFKEPIPLYNHLKEPLKKMKYHLTARLWNQYVSDIEEPQYQGLNQGFRMVGSPTKLGKEYRLTAFKIGDKIDLDYLNSFITNEDDRVTQIEYQSTLTLEQAKEKYPDWYDRKINGNEKKKTWKVKRDLYDWWLGRIKNEATYGHRYFCIMALAIYAIKCDIPFSELEQDSYDLIPRMNEANPQEPFTHEDVLSALNAYDENYKNFPRADLEKLTAIAMPKNKRNYRTQEMHLKGARAIQEINNPNWRNENGAPTKEKQVYLWRSQNPKGTKAECIKDTGISKMTVYKWWDSEPEIIELREDDYVSHLRDEDFIVTKLK